MDSCLLMSQHINTTVCKSSWYALRKIGKIRKYVNKNDCEKLFLAFIASKLDSCNSVLYGLPATQLYKLQCIQNAAARLVSRNNKYGHITPIRNLHWLNIKNRITFKILLITFKALHGLAPIYINDIINIYKPTKVTKVRWT
jgi:hypothetical protein